MVMAVNCNSKKKPLEIDGKTWIQYSVSIWKNIQKSPEEKKLNHPAIFPTELIRRLLKMFSHEGDTVLDPFLGSGTTAVASALENRNCIGFEISEEYYKLAKNRIDNLCKDHCNPELYSESKNFTNRISIYRDDSRNLTKYVDEKSIDICITSPPYWNVLSNKRTADGKQTRDYKTDNINDISKLELYEDFLSSLEDIFSKVYSCLKDEGYCILIVMDIRKKNKFYPLHCDIIYMMNKIGFSIEDIIIWDRQHEYNNIKPLGYPFIMRINKVHEYILIFKKK